MCGRLGVLGKLNVRNSEGSEYFFSFFSLTCWKPESADLRLCAVCTGLLRIQLGFTFYANQTEISLVPNLKITSFISSSIFVRD